MNEINRNYDAIINDFEFLKDDSQPLIHGIFLFKHIIIIMLRNTSRINEHKILLTNSLRFCLWKRVMKNLINESGSSNES